jgi:hypothetical protein
MFVPNYSLTHLFSYTATVRLPPEMIGPSPEGIRANFYITGGEILGPKLKGTVEPVGADWFLMRQDGVGILDVRATLKTDDDALIYTTLSGVEDWGEDGYGKFVRGDLPSRVEIRAIPRFQTAAPAYLWLNRLLCLNVGYIDITSGTALFDVYAT